MFYSTAYAEPADTSVIARIVDTFNTKTTAWMGKAKQVAITFFKWCFILEIAYIGIRASISVADTKETIQNFVMAVLTASFFMAVISNYQEWSNALIYGLQAAADQMSGIEKASDNPFKAGLTLADTILDKISGWSPMESLAYILTGAFVIVCFALITAQIIVIKCESMIAMLAACILLGLGASSFFKEYAINTMRYVFSVAFKLFTMQLVIGVGYTFIAEIKVGEADWPTLFTVMGFSVVLLTLVKTLPDTVAGIISGSHVGSGGGLMSSVRTISSLATGAAAAAGGAIAAGSAMNSSKKLAQATGASGFADVAKSMGKNMMTAKSQSGVRKTTMRAELEDRLAQAREFKK